MDPSSLRAECRLLSTQQRELLTLIAAGLGTRAMAERLGRGADEVRGHLAGALRDLKVCSVTKVTARALELGLIRQSDP